MVGGLAQGQMCFYWRDDYAGKGPVVILLAERKWTSFLKMRAGFTAQAQPFFTRPRREGEPETHANGHPWAWIYGPDEVLKDEVRWLESDEFEALKTALEVAKTNAKLRCEEVVNHLALAA